MRKLNKIQEEQLKYNLEEELAILVNKFQQYGLENSIIVNIVKNWSDELYEYYYQTTDRVS